MGILGWIGVGLIVADLCSEEMDEPQEKVEKEQVSFKEQAWRDGEYYRWLKGEEHWQREYWDPNSWHEV